VVYKVQPTDLPSDNRSQEVGIRRQSLLLKPTELVFSGPKDCASSEIVVLSYTTRLVSVHKDIKAISWVSIDACIHNFTLHIKIIRLFILYWCAPAFQKNANHAGAYFIYFESDHEYP